MSDQRNFLRRGFKTPRMLYPVRSMFLLLLGLGVALLIPQAPSEGRPAMPWLIAVTSLDVLASSGSGSSTPNLSQDSLDAVADEVWGQPDFASNSSSLDNVSINGAKGVFYDSYSDQIFVADTQNHRVLGWNDLVSYQTGDPATFVLGQTDFLSNTVANPPTSSSLNSPAAVAMDYDGNLYVADSGNNRILIFEPGENGFTSGMDAAVVIGQADFTSNKSVPITDASLFAPMGLAVDRQQNLVVADTQNNRVLLYEPPLESGMKASWVVGQPADAAARLGNFTVAAAPNPPTATSLKQPTGVAIRSIGDVLFVADSGNHRVLAYTKTPIDGRADVVIGQPDFTTNIPNQGGLDGSSLNSPGGVHFDSGDRLFVADTANHRVLLFPDPLHSAIATTVFGQPNLTSANEAVPPSAGTLISPTQISSDDVFGDLYIIDSGNNRVLRYDHPLPNPRPQVLQLSPATVRAGNPATQVLVEGPGIISSTLVFVNGQVRTPVDRYIGAITVELHEAELANAGIVTLTLQNSTPGGGVSPEALVTIYTPQTGDTRADAVKGQLGFTNREGEFNLVDATTLYYPYGVTVSPLDGRVFVADYGNARVLSWRNQQALLDSLPADLVIGQKDFTSYDNGLNDEALTAAELDGPVAVAVDGNGNLYVADADDNRVLIYQAPLSNGMAATRVIGQPDFASYEAQEPSESSLNTPLGLALNNAGDLYVADSENNRVLRFDTPLANNNADADRVYGQGSSFDTGEINRGGLSSASLNYPIGVAVDGAGNLYVADSDNNRVLIYTGTPEPGLQATVVLGQGGDFASNDKNKFGVDTRGMYIPGGLAIGPEGALYIADSGNHRLLVFNSVVSGGDVVADGVFGQQNSFTSNEANLSGVSRDSLNYPWQPAFDGNGNLFLTDTDNHRLLVYFVPPTLGAKDSLFLPTTRR